LLQLVPVTFKDDVEQGLVGCFDAFQAEGIFSIYLSGSITGPDFNPETSDIDSIAIVDDNVPQKLENILQEYLKNEVPHIHKFKIRILYISELISLERKSVLTSFISPQILLLDFPYWKHVCGQNYSSSDFASVTYLDGMKTMQEAIETWHWQFVENVTTDKIVYYLKMIARIIWMYDGMKGNIYPFSYTELVHRKNGFESLASIILNLKKNNWSEEQFIPHTQEFQEFVDELPKLIS